MTFKRPQANIFSLSNYEFVKALSDAGSMSVLGYTFGVSFRMTIPAGGEEDILLELPDGVKVFFHSRQDEVVGGQLEWEFRVNPDPGYTAAETKKAHNFNSEGATLSQGDAIRTSAPTTGSTFIREGINYPEGAGANSSSGIGFDQAGAVPSFTSAVVPMIRFKNTNSSSMLIVVNWIWSEVPLELL